jgi:hypothetical protein
MLVAALSAFPASLIAGDTLRVNIPGGDHPATAWTLKVLFASGTGNKSFDATANGDDFLLTLSAAQTATLTAGQYAVANSYTETATGERYTDPDEDIVAVFPDPTTTVTESIAKQTLDALEASLLIIAGEPDTTVSFNGQTFTGRNLPELQKAIVAQKQIVAFEENKRRVDAGLPSNRFSKMRF